MLMEFVLSMELMIIINVKKAAEEVKNVFMDDASEIILMIATIHVEILKIAVEVNGVKTDIALSIFDLH